jgi:hypothetical protein
MIVPIFNIGGDRRMADELKITGQLWFTKGGIKINLGTRDHFVTVSGDHAIHKSQEIGTSAEALDIGEITTVGYCWFRNMDSTNFVEIGYDDTGFKNLIKLKAGEECGPVRLGQGAPYALADTAAVDLEYVIIED